eukprot:1256424-Prymnesium_polylepis.1
MPAPPQSLHRERGAALAVLADAGAAAFFAVVSIAAVLADAGAAAAALFCTGRAACRARTSWRHRT